jgi:hypothetical protein
MPRSARSVTTDGTLWLESGLEQDLVRWLDRRSDVDWIVAQPVMLHFAASGRRRAIAHTPDLLTSHVDGTVTLWDVRPDTGQDELFVRKSLLTRTECDRIGWRYEVFAGLPTPERMNILWLAGYRRPMPWHAEHTETIAKMAQSGPLTVQDIRSCDAGDGELLSTMWHLIWSGRLGCDLTAPIRGNTELQWADTTSPETLSLGGTG